MDFFEINKKKQLKKNAPLAARMRPESLEEYVGQDHLIARDKPLYRMIRADRIGSMIFYGPPGTGKTTLAYIIAKTTKMNYEKLSAVTAGVKDIREITKKAEDNLSMYNSRTILFIDEIHRFNKSQQDALLPFVENGTLILIGATTENPYFEVNKALLSRCQILQLKHLTEKDIRKVLIRALEDKDRGFGNYKVEIEEDALAYLIRASSGDARTALNSLELAVLSTDPLDGLIKISFEDIKNSTIKKVAIYDKSADEHYNTVSAFIKSMRGSDPDASLYYLALMLNAGEDIKFIARRMIIFASEDIGNADPKALDLSVSCFNAINIIGMPEARIILSQTAIYLALAPKSNSSYLGIDRAMTYVRNSYHRDIPNHLKDSHYSGAKDFDYGTDYKYPHDYNNGYVDQDYLPEEIKDRFYSPVRRGYEKKLVERLDIIKKMNKE